MNRLAALATLVLLLPVADAAETSPVVARGAVWLEEARVVHDRVLATHDDIPSEFASAWARLSEGDASQNVLGLAATVAYFHAVADYLDARENMTVDYRTDGRAGCTGNSSCARFLALTDAAVEATGPRHAAALERARVAWSDVERAQGLESAVIAQAALDDSRVILDSYPTARDRLTALPTYDPTAPAYEHLLVAAWTAATTPGLMIPLAEELVEAAEAADAAGPHVDPGRLAAASSALAGSVATAPEAAAPEVGAAYLAARAASEYDRLIFTTGDGDSNARLRAAVEQDIAEAAPALTRARDLGYEGLLLADALHAARREAADASASDGALARAAGELVAAVALHERLLDPAVVAASPEREEGGSGVVVAAVATAGALALVGAAALLLRRKP